MVRRLIACVLPSALALACGSLPDDPSRPEALATLEGQLTNQGSLPLDGDVRIAVIWRRPRPGGGVAFSVVEDVPVEPVFPSKFRIALRSPPPAAVMVSAADAFGGDANDGTDPTGPDRGAPEPARARGAASGVRSTALGPQDGPAAGDLRVALGTLVAYVDENRNGRLDLVDEGARDFIDRVVATNDELVLGYFEGDVGAAAPHFEVGPGPGYNLVDTCRRAERPRASDEPPPAEGACTGWRASPASAPFTLPVTASPNLNEQMCTNGGGEGSGSTGGFPGLPAPSVQPDRYPAPDDPNLRCGDGGTSYLVEECVTVSEGLCKGTRTDCRTTAGYRRPDPVPAGWPCPGP
jgi:hypothetical protein